MSNAKGFGLILLCVAKLSTARVVDYTQAHFIAVEQGKAAVYNDYVNLIHMTNLTNYRIMAEETNNIIDQLRDKPHLAKILTEQTEEIFSLIKTLDIPRRFARSIDFIGSALKFIAGTPDHDDFELLSTKQNYLIENNNKQTTINSALENKINEITEQINNIRKTASINNVIPDREEVLFELYQNRNNRIKTNLNTIALSVVLAKNNITNPLILDDSELNKIISIENFPISVESLLSAAKLKILQNTDIIYYVLRIPKIFKFCNYINIYPVIKNSTIVKLSVNEALSCPNVTLPIKNCIYTATAFICQPTLDACLSQLLNNNTAKCPTESSHHLTQIQQVSDGVVILNDVFPTKIVDQQEIELTRGTYLITFMETISINSTEFSTIKKNSLMEAHPPKTMKVNYETYDVKLSLPYLHKIHIDNTKHINTLQEEIIKQKMLWFISIPIIAILILFIAIIFIKRNLQPKINVNEIVQQLRNRSEDAST